MMDAADPRHLSEPGPVQDAVLAGLTRDIRRPVDHRGVWIWVLAAVALAIGLVAL